MRSSTRSKHVSTALACAAMTVFGAGAAAAPQGTPDVIAYDIGVDGSNANDIRYYGQAAGIAAYSFATQSCSA